MPDDAERLIPALQSLVEDATSISPVEAVKKDQKAASLSNINSILSDCLVSQAIEAEKEQDLGACLHLFVKICILEPTNHSARLNAAAIRLRLGNDTDRKFQFVTPLPR